MDAPPVQYVTTPDGYNIAYSVVGKGIPCVVVPVGFNHIGLTAQVTALRPWLSGLSERFMMVQFDSRGTGLSTRGLTEAFSQDDRVVDLKAVVERLALEPAVLFARRSAGHAAIRFAAAHPERVHALVLMGCSVTAEPWSRALLDTLANADWDVFLHAMASGGRSFEETNATIELLKQTVTQADFAHLIRTWMTSRVDQELRHVKAPALVLHLQHGRRPSLQESAELAAKLDGGRFVDIPGGDNTWGVGDFSAAAPHIDEFLASLPPHKGQQTADPAASAGLSLREVEVLRLVAAGKSNQQIADELVISINTVQRHVSNILGKTGLANRTEAASYAHLHHLV